MERRTLSFLFLLVSSTASAQATFTGYVRDSASLRGLGGAEITIDGSDRKTRSERDGKFNVRDIAAGIARVHVRLVGFAPRRATGEKRR